MKALDSLNSKLWRTTKAYCYEATLGNQGNVSYRGLGILISPKLQRLIRDYGTIDANQAQWITLAGLPRGTINIVKIYVPHTV